MIQQYIYIYIYIHTKYFYIKYIDLLTELFEIKVTLIQDFFIIS